MEAAEPQISTIPWQTYVKWIVGIFFVWVLLRVAFTALYRWVSGKKGYMTGEDYAHLTDTSQVQPYHNGVGYAVSYWSDMSGRPYQEDRHLELQGPKVHNSEKRASLYGIFDGHGGYRASQYCKDVLMQYIVADPVFTSDVAKSIRTSFFRTDAEFSANAKLKRFSDGSTAIVAVIQNGVITVGNAGDCRAVLVKKTNEKEGEIHEEKNMNTADANANANTSGSHSPINTRKSAGQRIMTHADASAVALSDDHKPNRIDEEQRIRKLGGHIKLWGSWRVMGVLAVSRAIGDVSLQPYVTCDPEITQHTINPEEDMFLVLASDGVWDVLSNEDVAGIVMQAALSKPWNEVARELCDEAKYRGSQDNITAQVIDLSASFYPQPGPGEFIPREGASLVKIGSGTGRRGGGGWGERHRRPSFI